MRGIPLVLLCLAQPAVANPIAWDGPSDDIPSRPALEWSTWFRLGFGIEPQVPETIALSTTTPDVEYGTGWAAALGVEASVGLDRRGDVRVGMWGELRGLEPIGGAELVLTRVPKRIDMFLHDGQGILALRGGGNHERGTAAIAYGYLAAWKLWGPWTGASRYMIGVRFVATYTRAWDDPRDWSATFGLETEPIGALRYLLGIRSWY
jgi:hypothetical protein